MRKILSIFAVMAILSTFTTEAQYYNYNAGDHHNLVYNYDEGQVINAQYSSFPYWLINRRLTMSDLYGYDCYGLRILRNCIFAYHGYIFQSDDLRWYFNQCPWYYPRYSSQSKVMKMMSKTEKANIELIKKREKQLGC